MLNYAAAGRRREVIMPMITPTSAGRRHAPAVGRVAAALMPAERWLHMAMTSLREKALSGGCRSRSRGRRGRRYWPPRPFGKYSPSPTSTAREPRESRASDEWLGYAVVKPRALRMIAASSDNQGNRELIEAVRELSVAPQFISDGSRSAAIVDIALRAEALSATA